MSAKPTEGAVRYRVEQSTSGKRWDVHRDVLRWNHDQLMAEFFEKDAKQRAEAEAARLNKAVSDAD